MKALVLERERERVVAARELELFNLQHGPRLVALAKIRNIMRAQQLAIEDVRVVGSR